MNNKELFRIACQKGNFDIAKWLIEINTDNDINNEELFIISCQTGDLDIVQWLFHIKSDIDINYEKFDDIYSALLVMSGIQSDLYSLVTDIDGEMDLLTTATISAVGRIATECITRIKITAVSTFFLLAFC